MTQHDGARGLDEITLTRITATGYHGVLAEERAAGQQFNVDVTLHLDLRAAARGDDLARTVDYSTVASEVVDVLTGPPVDLIETVAEAIAERALRHDGVELVDVTVHKPYAPITVPFSDVTVKIRRQLAERAPAGGHQVVLALGANLGPARETLRGALTELDRHPRIQVTGVSPLLRSTAMLAPGADPQPDYLNAVATVLTELPLPELLALCQGIELGHGRQRTERWGARTLDIDIIAAGEQRRDSARLSVPHPRAHERSFVLAPWLRLDPHATLPGHGPVTELPAAREDIEWLEADWWAPEEPG